MANNEKAMKNIREAAELIAALASAPHPAPDAPCKGCTGYWYDNGVLHCDDECPAPDATDWKALAETEEKWNGVLTEDNKDLRAQLTAAQAENEKLRELLSQTVSFIRSDADEDDYFLVGQREDLLHEVLAALSPPPLSPEKE